ncbi:hypothetical protein ABKA04_005368 [Annulohypoxylon sp. FPYF3050]
MPNIRKLIPWTVLVSALTIAVPHRFDEHDQQPIPVTGMTTGINNRTGERSTRWEINALEHEGGPRWDLYIQGLAALQEKTETDKRSHFSLAGIHGMPYIPYNGFLPFLLRQSFVANTRKEGQFVAWHRPYLALYEQILGREIQLIAARYNTSHRNSSVYREAAQAFRLPYWDWASNARLPPSYRWPTYPLNQTQFPGSAGWPNETTRASDGKSDFSLDVVNANLAAVAGQLKDQVYRTFAYAETYDQMSSMADPEGLSLEAAHNIVHNAVGGSFASIDATAFDPLFMLHHANVDRLAALWQAAHPNDTYQSQTYASGGLYGTARGENVTAESPVKPFYRADGKTFHTGISTSSVEAFGYTYPELQGLGSGGITWRINNLYGNDYDDTKSTGQDWFVEVAANRSELELPCNIDVHLGEVFAGRVALLSMPMHGVGRNAVEKILRAQLRVDIIKGNGATINSKDVSGIKLNLAVIDVTSSESGFELAKYGNKKLVPLGD